MPRTLPLVIAATVLSAAAVRVQTAAAQAPAPSAARARSDSAAIAKARADSARLPYTAADVQFITGMIGHHAQAIAMARLIPTHGASESIRVLGGRVINAQQDEITLMSQWLRDRRQPVPDVLGAPHDMAGMAGMSNMAGMAGMQHTASTAPAMAMMPGMLTPAQFAQLDAARGPEFDRLFLRLMIQHHEGAVTMVHDLFATPGAGQDEAVFKLASDANVDQSTEIARMQRMLAAILFGTP